uniref:Signal transduction histidine kinase dimerisation/phosphoacceptor domain-containing protein n=1 Tax=Panagrolaimus superbus TaxID=310955 RepID=A0A914XUJ8_9BILA
MLLRMRKWILVHDDTATKIQRISPYLFLATLIGYLLFGAGSFWLFEKQYVTKNVRQFYLKLAVNRQQFAREITHKLFNDTKNLFVIMDLNQSNRVQAS